MAHRLTKKQHKQNQPEHSQPETEMPYYNQQPNKTQISEPENKLPRPIFASTSDINTHDTQSFKNNEFGFPPAESVFVSNNHFNAGPDFIRPTSGYIFSNSKKSQFPLGIWVMPFGSEKVSQVHVNEPLRCNHCRSYANPYFRYDGTKTVACCNICGVNFQINPTQAESEQVATEGVIDFVVKDKNFMKKRTDIVKVIIAIEISHFLVDSNAFTTIIDSARAALEGAEFEKNVRIGVVIFNGEGVTYLKPNRSENWSNKQPMKYTIKYSLFGLCCPLSDKEMLLDPKEDKDKLLYLLDWVAKTGIEQYRHGQYISQGSNYALVLKSLIQGFENEIGRAVIFAKTTPKSGPLSLRPRNEEDNKNPLKSLTPDYYDLGKELVKARIGVDMFIFSKEALSTQELATTHFLSSHTGGKVYYYSPFSPETHNESLYYNVYGVLSRKYVYDINFTTRFSKGLNLVNFGVGDGIYESRDIFLGMFDSENSVAVSFEQEEKIENAYVQFAIIFSNGEGQRIIRVINYRMMVSNKIEEVHETCDYLAFANLLLRQCAHKIIRTDPLKVRQELIQRLIHIIVEYVQEIGHGKRNNSLFLAHQNLSTGFAYIHGFINSKVFLNSIKMSPDARIIEILKVNNASFLGFANAFYPKLYSLGMEIYETDHIPGDLIDGKEEIELSVVLPPNLPLSSESVKKDGIYLAWTMDSLIIFIQPEIESSLLHEIFGTEDYLVIEEMSALPELESSHNIRINMIIEELRRRTTKANGNFLPLKIRTNLRKGPYTDLLSTVLKEDYQECRFYSFMDLLHREIQSKLK